MPAATCAQFLAANGRHCPNCNSSDIAQECIAIGDPQNQALTSIAWWCNACESEWEAVWRLTGYKDLTVPEKTDDEGKEDKGRVEGEGDGI